MKTGTVLLFCSLVLVIFPAAGNSQTTVITNDPAYTGSSSAILDVKATSKGFLPPRVALAGKSDVTTIPSPATGLLVYNTHTSSSGDVSPGYYYYNGTTWQVFSSGIHFIGEEYGGGKVFWSDETGQHGLVALTEDQASIQPWTGGPTAVNTPADGIYGGEMNTWMSVLLDNGGSGVYFAALSCQGIIVTVGGTDYGSWYLPSRTELSMMYQHKAYIGAFTPGWYWSSNSMDASNAWDQSFINGAQDYDVKTNSHFVRCIRKF
jgi:hypothetical protein